MTVYKLFCLAFVGYETAFESIKQSKFQLWERGINENYVKVIENNITTLLHKYTVLLKC